MHGIDANTKTLLSGLEKLGGRAERGLRTYIRLSGMMSSSTQACSEYMFAILTLIKLYVTQLVLLY